MGDLHEFARAALSSIAVDFDEFGDPLKVVDACNGL